MLIVSGNGSLCIQMFILFYEKKKMCIAFLSCCRIISDYNRPGDSLCTGYGFRDC